MPSSVFARVGGTVLSVHRLAPGTAPLSWARSSSVHVHLGAEAPVRGVLDDGRFAHVARPGDFSVIPTGCPSQEEWSEPVCFLTLELDVDGALEEPTALVPMARVADRGIGRLADRAGAELRGPDPPDRWELEAVVTELGARVRAAVSRADGRAARSVRGEAASSRHLRGAVLRAVVDRIHDEHADDLSVTDLARMAGLSVAHFTRSFRAAVGCTPYQYVVRVRVRRAERLLALTDLPISEVANQVGFAHQPHLHRHFLRWTGTTPGRFVRHHRRRASTSGTRSSKTAGSWKKAGRPRS